MFHLWPISQPNTVKSNLKKKLIKKNGARINPNSANMQNQMTSTHTEAANNCASFPQPNTVGSNLNGAGINPNLTYIQNPLYTEAANNRALFSRTPTSK